MIQHVFLWTDTLIFILLVAVLGFAWFARNKEHLRAPWREVVRSRMAVASLVVLSIYTITGLLDSVHFRKALPTQEGQQEVQYSGDVLSVLDTLLGPMRTQDEKTYSAPFAAYLYARETVTGADGEKLRIFPRLEYGGAGLTDPATQKGADIARRTVTALAEAVAVLLLLYGMLGLRLASKWRQSWMSALGAIAKGTSDVPWRTALLTLGVFVLLIALVVNLSGAYHLLGTDKVGQDVLYQTIKSIRTGLVIGTLTTLVMLPFAVFLGMMAGYFRGWVDDVIQYIYTTLNSIPGVLLIAAAVMMMQVYVANHPELFETMAERADIRLLFLVLILGITSWTGLCRLLRGETLKLRELDYVQAADAFGVAKSSILVRHLLPNLMHLVMIAVVLDFSGLVLAEAVLSYVGVGVDPTTQSWGNMINRARLEMAREPMVWWSLLASFSFMFTLVLAANLFSDVVRDAFDPRLRAQR
ncbi:MAG TPA: ABC transporter permease [Gammaproteobacteria bacterium]|nr:ABC transporter permease [Gammaproteobacteria bacterium]